MNMNKLDNIPFMTDNPVFRYMADMADISAYETAINKGLAKGRAEGMAGGEKKGRLEGKAEGKIEGLKEGLSKGKMEGVKEEKMQTARRMKTEGFSIELIAKMTGLSPEEIASL